MSVAMLDELKAAWSESDVDPVLQITVNIGCVDRQ